MRLWLSLWIGVVFFAWPFAAWGTGVCDPDGHFCIQLDATSAHVCDVLAPRGLDKTECDPSDIALRDALRHKEDIPIRALVVRFEDEQIFVVEVDRHPPSAELEAAQLAEHERWMRSNLEATQKLDAFTPLRIVRVNGVQTVRFDSQRTQGDDRLETAGAEVRAMQATYTVLFQGPPGPRLTAFADAALATVDALPIRRAGGAGEAVTWLVRGLVAAIVVVGVAWAIRRRRGRRGGMNARDLWPQ